MNDAALPCGYHLRLDFDGGEPLALPPGVLDIGTTRGSSLGPVEPTRAQLRFVLDRRGLWLDVREARLGVHVNGRPVRRMALLRGGDAIFLNGRELQVLGRMPDDIAELPPLESVDGDLRIVLRGTGGQFHGRAFTLEQPRTVGSDAGADIRIDDPGSPAQRAQLHCMTRGRVLLRVPTGVAPVLVNGHRVREVLLRTGDQVVFDAHHRFVVEAPLGDLTVMDPELVAPEAPPPVARSASLRRLPWVLVAAALIGGLLSLLLFAGGR
ncbi:MAG: FHA domain-containing protein [Pseudoxanthomonas suwonensis]|nr:FHA domain-containing protein [Pseudoxanthomonas suwonensis]